MVEGVPVRSPSLVRQLAMATGGVGAPLARRRGAEATKASSSRRVIFIEYRLKESAVGQDAILRRVVNPPKLRRLPIGAQVGQPAPHPETDSLRVSATLID